MNVDDLTLINLIGKSSFGEIYLSSKNGSSTQYATKVIDKSSIENTEAKTYIDNEISILKEINHPNIVNLIEIKDTEEKLYIVQEYCNGGGLDKFLEKYHAENKKGLPEEMVQYIMRQILSAMEYLSSKEIMHRQIKLDNILINYEDENDRKNNNIMKATIKLIDFSFAIILKKGELTDTILGSPINMSPTLLHKLNNDPEYKDVGYDEKEDIWSLGTICYELLMGRSAFESEDMDDLYKKVNKGDYYVPITFSKETVSFLNGMLQYYSNKRLSFNELNNHKFLKKNINEFEKIELNGFKNMKCKENSQILLNTKSNESFWVLLEMDFKKFFEE
jgi:serine/threonine protein kinase